MGARGPHKKPKPLAIAGSIQPGREFDSTPPNHLGKPGLDAWKSVVVALADLGLLHFADRASVTAYCVAHDRIDSYEETMSREGQSYVGPNGAICLHPLMKCRKDEEAKIERFQKQYGMTAVSRTGLNIGAKKSAPSLATRKRG
jgi:P27 family predicted phage terminase small subunit